MKFISQKDKVIDYEDFMLETGLEWETLFELYQVFLQELLSEKERLINLHEAGDMVKTGKIIHNIKGISGSYKAVRIYKQACLMDSDFKKGLYDNVSSNLPILVNEIDIAVSDIERKILTAGEI